MKPVQFIPFYLMWIISGALSVVCWMMLRAATVSIVALIERLVPMERQIESGWYLRWVVRASDPCSLVVFSIFALASIILFDFLYRTAIGKGTIKRVFFTVTGIQVGIILLCALTLLVSNLVAV
jgi:hypothetical protein